MSSSIQRSATFHKYLLLFSLRVAVCTGYSLLLVWLARQEAEYIAEAILRVLNEDGQ